METQEKYPYFNDYDLTDNFYKILFKPTHEIQTRELNQLQTMLQQQLSLGANNIFKDGSLLKGCNHDLSTTSVLLSVNNPEVITYEFIELVKSFPMFLQSKNNPSYIVQILFIEAQNIIVNEISSSTLISDKPLAEIDTFYLYNPETKTISTDLEIRVHAASLCTWVKVNEGIIYKDGFFIRVPEQRKFLCVGLFTGSVGLRVIKSILNRDSAIWRKEHPALNSPDKLVIKMVLDFIPPEGTFVDNFIEFLRVENGVLLKDVRVPIFAELEKTLARRTFDQWGSYTVKPFIAKVTYEDDPLNFDIELSSGKAYVSGYEFETIAPTYLKLERALDYEITEDYYLPINYGSTITLKDVSGTFNSNLCEKIIFYSDTVANVFNANDPTLLEIGEARIKAVQFSGTEVTLYLFDFFSYPEKLFEDALSVLSGWETWNGAGNLVTPFEGIKNNSNSSLVFTLPEECIRSIRGEKDEINTEYFIQKLFYSIQFNPSLDIPENVEALISVPFDETIVGDIFQFIIMERLNEEAYRFPSSFSFQDELGKKVKLVVENAIPFTADVYAKVQVPFTGGKTKTLETVIQTVAFNSSVSKSITLSHEVHEVVSIKDNVYEDYTEVFTLVNNNTLEKIIENTLVYDGPSLTKTLTITFKKWVSSEHGYTSVNSFPEDPEDRQETIIGSTFKVRNVIDFRPVIGPGQVNYIPLPNTFFVCDFSYYLGRMDLLVATPSKKFDFVRGVPSKNPLPPLNFDKSFMVLYQFLIPPFSKHVTDVKRRFIENKRYTMHDIRNLEERIENLEYYTALSLLEKETADQNIVDEFGNPRLKNGFVVDNFKTANTMEYTSVDNNCAIDTENSLLRPSFDILNAPALYNPYESKTRRSGDLITVPYVEVPYIEQLKASNVMNLQPFEVFSWVGTLDLFPCTDEWVDTTRAPSVIANLYGENDIWEQIGTKAFKTLYGDWERTVLGAKPPAQANSAVAIPVSPSNALWNPASDPGAPTTLVAKYNEWVDSNYTAGFAKQPDGYLHGKPAVYIQSVQTPGIDATLTRTTTQAGFTSSSIVTSSLGSSVSDVSLVHFLRAKTIRFTGKNLKPNTRFYLLFDKVNLTSNCEPTVLTSNAKGVVTGVLNLPGGRFTVGDHVVTLTNTLSGVDYESSAVAKYSGSGLNQTVQESFVSTREPNIAVGTTTQVVVTPTPSVTPTVTPTKTPTPTISASPSPTPSQSSIQKDRWLNVAFFQAFNHDPLFKDAHVQFSSDIPGIASTQLPVFDIGVRNYQSEWIFIGDKPSITITVKIDSNNQEVKEYLKKNYILDECWAFGITKIFNTGYYPDFVGPDWNSTYNASRLAEYTFKKKGTDYPGISDIEINQFFVTKQQQTALEVTFTIPLPKFNKYIFMPIQLTARYPTGVLIYDPVGESFFVDEKEFPEGIFLSSAELFFKAKSNNASVTFELRPSVNGYPSNKEVIPFSVVTLDPDDIQISDDASKATKFTFSAPVYLKPGEYHFVARAKDTKYKVWIARVGEFELGKSEKRITQNPYIGVLEKSSNNLTWIPDSGADLKFRLNRCSFKTNVPFKSRFENSPYFSEERNKTNLEYNTLRFNAIVLKPNNTFIESGKLTLKNSELVSISVPKVFVENTTVELENAYYLEDHSVTPSKTKILKLLPNPEERNTSEIGNIDVLWNALVDSNNYYTPSSVMEFDLKTNKENVSPAIDLQRLSCIYVTNLINKPAAFTEEETVYGGTAIARYIVKPIKLAIAVPANTLYIAFKAQLPSDSLAKVAVSVYYKVWSSTQDASSSIQEKHWYYVGSAETSSLGYIDFEYTVEDLNYESAADSFDWFSIKLVMESKNTGFVPKIKDFRAIALTT